MYKCVSADDAQTIETSVNKLLAEGYRLQGGVGVVGTTVAGPVERQIQVHHSDKKIHQTEAESDTDSFRQRQLSWRR